MTSTLIVADDHPLVRAGVRQIVSESASIQTVAEAADAEGCIAKVMQLKPDFLVLDINLSGTSGFDVVVELNRLGSDVRTVILSMHATADFVSRARELGCHGFVAKEDAGMELVGILNVRPGQFAMSSSAGRGEDALDRFRFTAEPPPSGLDLLTPKEHEVLRLLAEGLTSRQIAEAIGISQRTVHTHRQNICRKMELSGPNALLLFALENSETLKHCDPAND